MGAMNHVGEQSDQERMIQQQIIERGIREERVLGAMRAVPRDRFFPSTIRGEAFADRAAPIGHGQTISQPYIVALMTHRLSIEPGHRVLEIGTGSGYQTAILARLAGEVFTVERVKPLLDEAWERLMSLGIRNVHFRHGDGTTGWPTAAPFDRLLITASAPEIPEHLLRSHLIDGGVAVLPIGRGENQMLIEVRRVGDRLDTADLCPCRFVRLIGQEGWPQT